MNQLFVFLLFSADEAEKPTSLISNESMAEEEIII